MTPSFYCETTVRSTHTALLDTDILPISRPYEAVPRSRRSLHVCLWSFICRKWAHVDPLSWETVFSAGFELSVLRGKRPYRWTIWVSRCVLRYC